MAVSLRTLGIAAVLSCAAGPASATLVVSTDSLDFGYVAPGDYAQTAVTLENVGTHDINGITPTIRGRDAFGAINNCPSPLIPGYRCRVVVSFQPLTEGKFNVQLLLGSDDPSVHSRIHLTGVSDPRFLSNATGPSAQPLMLAAAAAPVSEPATLPIGALTVGALAWFRQKRTRLVGQQTASKAGARDCDCRPVVASTSAAMLRASARNRRV